VSIHFISGKPGGGKSMYSMRLIIDELVHGTRMIVTNVPVILSELSVYLQSKYPKFYEQYCQTMVGTGVEAMLLAPRHLSDRFLFIEDEQMGSFFVNRGRGVRLESITNEQWKRGQRPDYSKVNDEGIFYVLDEVHIAFNSRAWADTGAEVLYYLSQHRKLGDDVVCITQSVANVDKQFRSVAQDYTYLKNIGKQRAGLFRLPNVFGWSCYTQPATDTSRPMESGTFLLDVAGLAKCYDTAKGVGIHGRAGADTRERKKGLHWIWFVVGAPIALIILFHFVPGMLARFMSRGLPKAAPVHQVTPAQPQLPPALPVFPARVQVALPSPAVVSSVYSGEEHTNDVYCTGYVILNNVPTVYLSNGTTIDGDSGRIGVIEKTFVVVDRIRLPVVHGKSILKPRVQDVGFVQDAPASELQAPAQFIEYVQPPPIQVTPPVGGGVARHQISGVQ
jgi:hypothetical protein